MEWLTIGIVIVGWAIAHAIRDNGQARIDAEHVRRGEPTQAESEAAAAARTDAEIRRQSAITVRLRGLPEPPPIGECRRGTCASCGLQPLVHDTTAAMSPMCIYCIEREWLGHLQRRQHG